MSYPILIRARYVFLGGLVIMAAYNWRLMAPAMSRWAIVLLVPILMLLSCAWTPQKIPALVYGLVTLSTMLAVLYAAVRFDWKTCMSILMIVLGIAATLSLLHPNTKTVYADAQEATLGIFAQKNVLGKRMMVLAVVSLTIMLQRDFRPWQRWLAVFCLVPGLVLVLRSNSATALLLTVAGVALTLALTVIWQALVKVRGARAATVLVVGLLALVCFLGFAATGTDPVKLLLDALGKDSDLTGRTGLWADALDLIKSHPWLGFGVEGFWRPGSSRALQIASEFTREEAAFEFNFQNVYLEYGVHLGYPGMVVIIGALVFGYAAICRDFFKYQDSRAGAFLVLATLILARSFTESDLFRKFELNLSIFWMCAAFALARLVQARSGMARFKPAARGFEVVQPTNVAIEVSEHSSIGKGEGHCVLSGKAMRGDG